jgi:excisionase family DNA binding protein
MRPPSVGAILQGPASIPDVEKPGFKMEIQYLRIDEAATLARCARSTIYELVRAKRLRLRKVGRRSLIARQELLQLIEGAGR